MEQHWEKLLNPQVLRQNLISASIFISAYELCRSYIIGQPRMFFSDYWMPEQKQLSPEYNEEVLSLSQSPLEASLLWFKSMGAIDDGDLEKFNQARQLRNKLAHDLPKYISEPGCEIEPSTYEGLIEVTQKLGVWWVMIIELSINQDFSSEVIDESSIKVGTVMMIQVMMDIAYGNEPEEGYYYNEMRNLSRS